MPDADDLQAAVLAWLDADSSRGYRKASQEFGLPYATVQQWGRAHRAGSSLPKPNARTRARASSGGPAVEPPPKNPMVWNPAECTRDEFLIRRIADCMAARDMALAQGHGGVARQWETTIGDYRDQLDLLRDEKRRADEARGRTEWVDPVELAKRITRRAGILARLCPDEARRLYLALGVALGEREVG